MLERKSSREVMVEQLVARIMAEADALRVKNKLEFRPSVFAAMKNVGIKDNDPHRSEYLSRVMSAYGKRQRSGKKAAEPVQTEPVRNHDTKRRNDEAWKRMIAEAAEAERLHPPDAYGADEDEAA